jgi:hypothetical protein
MAVGTGAETIQRRALNRALLERQWLLGRLEKPIGEAVEHLVGLQAQAALPPYFGLWSRLESFDPHELGRMLTERELVRLTLMRATVHLVTVRDARSCCDRSSSTSSSATTTAPSVGGWEEPTRRSSQLSFWSCSTGRR